MDRVQPNPNSVAVNRAGSPEDRSVFSVAVNRTPKSNGSQRYIADYAELSLVVIGSLHQTARCWDVCRPTRDGANLLPSYRTAKAWPA